MKRNFFIVTLLSLGFNSFAQTANNGLSANSGNIQLGGTLNQTTTIDQSGFGFHLKNGNIPIFTTLANGNVGVGTTAPLARLSFLDAHLTEEPIGIGWYNGGYGGDATQYGIHRTAGPWSAPNYAQLRLGWLTGIVLDPGVSHGKSYVDIVGNGLRVTQGSVGIGTTTPTEKLQVNGNIYSTGLKLNANNYLYWDDPNTSITRMGNVLTLKEYTGQINLTGSAGLNVVFTHPTNGNANFSFPSNRLFALRHGASYILQSSWSSANECWVKLGAADAQYADANGARLYLTGGKGGSLSGYNGGDVFIDGGERGGGNFDGNIFIGSQFGKVGIGTTTPHSKFEVNVNNGDDQSHYIPTTWDSYSSRFNGGNVSIFSTGSTNTYGDSYQLSFYARYGNAGQGIQTNKAAYIKGSVVNDAILPPQACGRGTLVLGSVNTDYNNNSFNDVPAMYVTNAKVGIGVVNPESQLHTTGTVRFSGLTNDNAKDRVVVSDANGNLAYRDASTLGGSATTGWNMDGNVIPTGADSKIGTTSNTSLQIITKGEERIHIDAEGNVGIGTDNIANYKLSVEGTIRTRKVRVDPATWADYVFESDYKLRPLKEVEQYIQQNKHLPEVPTAAEVKKEGIDIGDNQAVLLKKIEELTLYVIQLQKQVETLEKKVNEK